MHSVFKSRLVRILIWGAMALVGLEAVAVGLAIEKIGSYGVPADITRNHFFLTRFTLIPFLGTPTIDRFESSTNTRYTGFDNACRDFITDSMLGWRNQPGISCSFLYPAGGAPYSIGMLWNAYDADGFMVSMEGGPQYQRRKPDDVFRFIMLGGSALGGFGAPPFGSIPAHVQRILNGRSDPGRSGKRFEVINAAVGGYNSAQQYLYLMSELIYYEPNVVIFYNGWSDSINRHGHFSDATMAYMRQAKKFKSVPFSSIRMKWHRDYAAYIERSYTPKGAAKILSKTTRRSLEWFLDHTGIGYWAWKLELRKNWKRAWKGLVGLFKEIEQRPSQAEALKTDFDPRTFRVFEENIRRLATLANLRGFNGMFVLQPIIGIDDKPYAPGERRWIDTDLAEGKIFRRSKFYELARPFYVSLSETHRDDKTLCYADLSGVFKNIEDRVYVDEGHLNSDGNRIVARAVVDQLAACGFLQSSAAAANAPADQISAVPAVR